MSPEIELRKRKPQRFSGREPRGPHKICMSVDEQRFEEAMERHWGEEDPVDMRPYNDTRRRKPIKWRKERIEE